MITVEAPASAREIRIFGLAQGVGFRPFVHRLAREHGIRGWIRNRTGDVEIFAEGTEGVLDGFLRAVQDEAPPLAQIERVEVRTVVPEGSPHFTILASAVVEQGPQPIPPDAGICEQCAAELADPGNRRYRHPFITCTDCGPRATVITAMPYDRERTSMAVFPLCPACRTEYETPGDRRHHAESVCCPDCGPRLWFEATHPEEERGSIEGSGFWGLGSGPPAPSPQSPIPNPPIRMAAARIDAGEIVAVRGLGGFQLAVDATSETAVVRLRERKHREAKPLAVMLRSLEEARRWAVVDANAAALLESPARPIVLLPARPAVGIARSVAHGLTHLGIMLPSTPVHALLLGAVPVPLVMTSGNRSGCPIAVSNEEARDQLGHIADGFLLHDREILDRHDDSVVRPSHPGPIIVRRARGYAPASLPLPIPAREPVLAVGAHLKSTLSLASGDHAWVSQHLGDLETLETADHFDRTRRRMQEVLRVEPRVVAHDLHPGYLSTHLAERFPADHRLGVQHHHAHVAAVMAEHRLTEPVLGLALDGTGYGDDGHIWGGELLLASLTDYQRLGHLRYLPLPGGDLAVRFPWRSALGALSGAPDAEDAFAHAFVGIPDEEIEMARGQIRRGINTPLASSMGRLFDAAAAVLGVRRVARYEAQAAMELEALAGSRPASERDLAISEMDGHDVVDFVPLLVHLGWLRQRGADVADLAADFHATVAWGMSNFVLRAVERTGVRTVALCGGVFQNARILASITRRLHDAKLEILLPNRLGPGDGAISYGQAAVAAARLAVASASPPQGGH